MQEITLRAYAKINLTLEVKGTRDDGYHEISTIFQSIALHDTVTLRRAESIELEVKGMEGLQRPENLAWRAAALLRERYPFPGVKIILEKNIPVAAGLAGGSTDAAAVLIGLNYLFGLGLTPGMLACLGERLGADVPFCILGGTALGRGKGERLLLLPSPPRLWLVIVRPSFAVSSREIYASWDAGVGGKDFVLPQEEEAVAALYHGDRQALVASLGNALEKVTCTLYPEVKAIKERLLAYGAEKAVMCGSGPAVFGVVPNREEAERIARRLKPKYPDTFITHTL
ncbi:4-diphosphocytidyl-2-C-methyl-D-erythritol kinase [Thermanaeromonas toyohensis ToBE]|uniref:4-diphosphocytidyl-2-C-methyl-D-erythritol kinase n=1 Tax=Thermanaeromonas toyohensis ToBE TaxID=698762 RepID=A0A1W1V7V3_9FIRM|nr:4-(cytidine 5'-diphospho)-2-C-methyl-D-erythritol kinase [Thermanaeromonas toyohensis]SMB89438.1 4-diphosphocytidyl-2-C-methyl-D-erythritol kinase [Thermanaeromonas toyohensis ToBE]